jgi:glc operon protein GlcG
MKSKSHALTAALLAGFVVVSLSSHGQEPASNAPLVTRERVALNLAGAELIIAQGREKAMETKVNVNIAVVDEGGHLLAFARMDKARPASASTAITKATAAATMRLPTGPVKRSDADADLLLNLALQNAAAASGGKMTSLLGGVPVMIDGQVIGAVGVGGGTGEQDAEIAKAGIEKLMKRLQ